MEQKPLRDLEINAIADIMAQRIKDAEAEIAALDYRRRTLERALRRLRPALQALVEQEAE